MDDTLVAALGGTDAEGAWHPGVSDETFYALFDALEPHAASVGAARQYTQERYDELAPEYTLENELWIRRTEHAAAAAIDRPSEPGIEPPWFQVRTSLMRTCVAEAPPDELARALAQRRR